MKKSPSRLLRTGALITAFCVLVLLSATGLPGQNDRTETEWRVPADAAFHIRASSASALAKLLDLYVSHAVKGVDDSLSGLLADVKKQSGIDVLDANSLKKAGIQTDGPLSLSVYDEGDSRNYLLIIPVTGGKSFPNAFTKLLQRVNRGRDIDLSPVITRYKKFAAYQVLNDIFFTADEKYFMLSSSGPLLRKTMDLSAGEPSTAPLSQDPDFTGLLACAGCRGDLLVFARKDLPWNIFGTKRPDDTTGNNGGVAADISHSGAVITSGDKILDATLLLKLSNTPSGKKFLSALTPGKDAAYPVMNDANFSAHLALNVKSLYSYCDSEGRKSALCPAITQTLGFIDTILSLDFSSGLLPLSGGVITLQTARTREPGKSDSILLYASRDPGVPASGLARAIRNELKSADSDNRGTEKIDRIEWFWKLDQQGNRVYISGGDNGIYIVNNSNLARTVLEGKLQGINELRGDFAGKRENIFSLARFDVRDESFIKTILLLSIYNSHRRLFNIAGVMDTVIMAGSVKDGAIIIDLRASLVPVGKK